MQVSNIHYVLSTCICYQRNSQCHEKQVNDLYGFGEERFIIAHKILRTMSEYSTITAFRPFFILRIQYGVAKSIYFHREGRAKYKIRALKSSLTKCWSLYNVANVNSQLTTVRASQQILVAFASRLPF